MIPEKRIRIKRSFYEPEPLPISFAKKIKIGRMSYQSEWRSIDRDLKRQWKDNARRYKAMRINEKIEFAKAGYKFPDQPECPAIITSPSSIRMKRGSNNGVMAHKLFEKLPKGFIILFSKLEVTDVPHVGDLQACYQVSLHAGRFLLTHTEEMAPHGLGQIVNHPVRIDPNSDVDPLLWHTKQNMTKANAELKRSQTPVSAQNIEDFPAYILITTPVNKGFEVLYNYGRAYSLARPVV